MMEEYAAKAFGSGNGIQRNIAEERERGELETRVLQRHGWIENIDDLTNEQLRSLIEENDHE